MLSSILSEFRSHRAVSSSNILVPPYPTQDLAKAVERTDN